MKKKYFIFPQDHTCKIFFIVFGLLNLPLLSQTTIINPAISTSPNGSFENATSAFSNNGWTVVNAATNTWFVGTQAFCTGTKAAYIGTAAGNNSYNTTTSQISHFYKDVTFPAG